MISAQGHKMCTIGDVIHMRVMVGRPSPCSITLVQSYHFTIIKRERGVFHFSIINILLLLSATLWIYGIEGNANSDLEFLNKTQ